ncbi:MAG: type II secretion system F family protein [Lentisphaeria bacterium]|nr:type II secretion system F family protein [Lentisphaeria bacterium]
MSERTYLYTAMDAAGKEHRGVLRVSGEDEAHGKLREQGLYGLSLVERKEGVGTSSRMGGAAVSRDRWPGPRLHGRALAVATRQLARLLRAGMPLVRALRLLAGQTPDPGHRRILDALATRIEEGACLSEALETWPRSFDTLYVSMVRAGEAAGKLEWVLERQSQLLDKRRRLVRKVRGAMTYPLVVCTVAVAITAGLMVFIVPKFAAMFSDMLGGVPLPRLTQAVVFASTFLLHRLHLGLALLLGCAASWRMLRATAPGRYWTDRLALRLPAFGPLLQLSACAHFCSTLGTLTASGVSILTALRIVRDASRNRVVSNALRSIEEAVKEGDPISRSMGETGAFPAALVGMVQVGEETGALPEMLARVAEDYEQDVDAAVEALTAIIEPVLIVGLAAVIGTIVVALFLPLVHLAGQMAGTH